MIAFIVFKLTLCLFFQKGELPLQKVQSFTYKNKPVVVYKSNENKDIAYKIILYADASQNKTVQTLVIRKANETIKHQIGANYILSELDINSNYTNYPYGWESLKVDMKDLREDCINIFDKKIQPLKIN